MAFTPNLSASFPIKPIAHSVAVPATAKTVFTDGSNTAVLIPADADRPRVYGSIFVQPANTFTGGRIMLYRFDGTSYFPLDDLAITGVSISTTAAFAKLPFPQWSKDTPLILPEGSSLLVATSVAQAAGSLFAHAGLGKVH